MAYVIGAIAAIFGGMKMLEEYENTKSSETIVEEFVEVKPEPIQELAPKAQINYVPEVTEDWNNIKKEKRKKRRQKMIDALDGKMSEKFTKLEEKIYEMWVPEKEIVKPQARVDREALEGLANAPELALEESKR